MSTAMLEPLLPLNTSINTLPALSPLRPAHRPPLHFVILAFRHQDADEDDDRRPFPTAQLRRTYPRWPRPPVAQSPTAWFELEQALRAFPRLGVRMGGVT